MFPFTVNALSATTANVIHGTAPYIELNDIKAVDLSSLLSIDVGGVKYVSDEHGAMKKVNADGTLTPLPAGTPIVLANAGDTFSSVKTLVPADTTDYVLNSTLPATSKKDDDGDTILGVSGNIKGVWTDKYGNPINTDGTGKNDLTGIASGCLSTYTLTLTTTNNPTISTQYGAPASSRQTVYGNNKAIFTINPATQPEICFAKPFSMHYSRGQYAGPASMWDGGTTGGTNGATQSDGKGFKLQSSYSANFPTTGADNLYFDLDIAGSPSALTWSSVTEGGITATMSSITATSVRVTLTGPKASSTQKSSNTPTPVDKPSLPATIELVGKDGSKEVVKYGFVIQQWFINRGSKTAVATGAGSQTEWCSKTGYTIVNVKDLTSAQGTAWNGGTIPTVPYPNQNSGQGDGSNYWRYIGGGLFSEWGDMGKYTAGTGSDWISDVYWTSDIGGIGQFVVYGAFGRVHSYSASYGYRGACRSQ